MKTFKEAYDYLKYTDAEDIAKRTAIYGAYANMYLKENFAHDYYLDIVVALSGPFVFNCLINDEKISNMLRETQYGFFLINNSWIIPLDHWVRANCSSDDYKYFNHILDLLESGKGDEILQHFNYIVQVICPDEYEYFPEMRSGIHPYSINNAWPRI